MNENSSILNTQNTTITLEEARKSVYQMNLIDDFLLTCLLTDEESGKDAARIILSALLNRNIRVVDVTSQKVFNGIHKDMRGICTMRLRQSSSRTRRSPTMMGSAGCTSILTETAIFPRRKVAAGSRI